MQEDGINLQKIVRDLMAITNSLREPLVAYEGNTVSFCNTVAAEEFNGIQKGSDMQECFGKQLMNDLDRRCCQDHVPCYFSCAVNDINYHITAACWLGLQFLIFTRSDEAQFSVLTSPTTTSLVAVQLREMLSNCFLALSVLHENVTMEGDMQLYVTALRRNLFRILRLSRNLDFIMLALSDRLALELSFVNLAERLKGLLEKLSPHMKRFGLRLFFQNATGDIFNVTLDIGKIELMLMQLLSNAIKYTPSGGQITVRLDSTESDVLLSVEDTGRGIPLAEMINIRRRFACKPDYSDARAGMGLGLSIVHEIVALHGGKIDMESTEGEGTTVHIRIPFDAQMQRLDSEMTLRTHVLYNDGIPDFLIEMSDVLGGDEYR